MTDVRVRIRGEDDTTRAFNRVERKVDNLGQQLRRATVGAQRFIGALAGAALAKSITNLVDADDAVGKLSRSLDVTVESLGRLQFAADRSGVSQREFATGIRTLIQATADAQKGTNDYSRAFDTLGLSAQKFAALSIDQRIEALADAFGQLPDGADRQDLAQTIFGTRGGSSFLNLLEEGSAGIRELGNEAQRLGAVPSLNDTLAAEAAKDSVTNLQGAVTGLGRTFNRVLLPTLVEVVEGLAQLGAKADLSAISFTRAGAGIGRFLGGLGDGSSFDVIRTLFGDVEAAARMNERWSATFGPVNTGITTQGNEAASAAPKIRELGDAYRAAAAGKAAFEGGQPEGGGLTVDNRAIVGGEALLDIENAVKELRGEAGSGDGLDGLRSGLESTVSGGILAGAQQGKTAMEDVFRQALARMAADLAASSLVSLLQNGFGSGGGLFGGIAGLLGFNDGGVVPGPRGAPRLAMVHGGETILPTHRSGFQGGGMTFNIDARGAQAGVEEQIRQGVAQAVTLSDRQRRDSQARGRG